jgi:riboflavin kinase / FMN adenylyltransferase
VSTVIEHVYSMIEDVTPAPTVVTVGAFDGVHRGHQHILQIARSRADALGARLLVLTFEPLPIQLFRPEVFPGRILTTQRRRELLLHYGADDVVELQFDRAMSMVTASQFMELLFAGGPLLEIWIGHDFALGHNREGTPSRLRELSLHHGTAVNVVERIDFDGRPVSSTEIRRLIGEGNADEASLLMGHRFQVEGTVEHGSQVGRQIGFPTANVAPPRQLVALQDGIYASLSRIEGETLLRPAMTYIGTRPAVNTGDRMIETHLFDFDGDLYGRTLVTEFVAHLREDRNFPSVEDLVQQLAVDEKRARDVLRARGATA